MAPWRSTTPGLLTLPSGRMIRGRGLLQPQPEGEQPTFGIYLLEDPPPHFDWESKWLRWQDFGLPHDDREVRNVLRDAWSRLAAERVEVACLGGIGRTGTALSCIAILDGVPAKVAVRYVRDHYRSEAVETVDQERYIERFVRP
jgi:protein-tyrosine phosphatase